MCPYIHTPVGDVYTFQLAVVSGFIVMVAMIHIALKSAKDRDKEEVYIFAKVFISAFVGYILSAVCDALFKLKQNGGFKISGVTFYGGLIGSAFCMYILLRIFRKNTEYTVRQWFDMLTAPLIAFHICGRIGCFLGGCCYGKATEGAIGVYFADVGYKCYPTQLIEAVLLAVILILVVTVGSKDRFKMYLLCYSTARFFIEFLRGDNRGEGLLGLSPAQTVSVFIWGFVLLWSLRDRFTLSTVNASASDDFAEIGDIFKPEKNCASKNTDEKKHN